MSEMDFLLEDEVRPCTIVEANEALLEKCLERKSQRNRFVLLSFIHCQTIAILLPVLLGREHSCLNMYVFFSCSEQTVYKLSAVVASVGVSALAVSAIYYKFALQSEGGSFPTLDAVCTAALTLGGIVRLPEPSILLKAFLFILEIEIRLEWHENISLFLLNLQFPQIP